MEFKPIETQEQFDEALKARLERERNTLKSKFEEESKMLADENTSLKRQLAEVQDFKEQVEALKKENAGYKLSELRTHIAMEEGLPFNLAGRIQGEDEESMRKDAQNLVSCFHANQSAAPLKSTEPRHINTQDKAYQNLLEGLDLGGE